jgi:hypothetical protein
MLEINPKEGQTKELVWKFVQFYAAGPKEEFAGPGVRGFLLFISLK